MIENLFRWEVGGLVTAILAMAAYFVSIHKEKAADAKDYAKDLRDMQLKSIESHNALAKSIDGLTSTLKTNQEIINKLIDK